MNWIFHGCFVYLPASYWHNKSINNNWLIRPFFVCLSCTSSFVLSFYHLFVDVYSFVLSFVHSLTLLSIHPFIHSFIRLFICSFLYLFIHSFTCFFSWKFLQWNPDLHVSWHYPGDIPSCMAYSFCCMDIIICYCI